MKKTRISIVIPVYNERESLKELVEQLDAMAGKRSEEFEYIFIDDGSSDGSFEELMKIKKDSLTPLTVIRFRKQTGKSAALACGFGYIKGEIVVTMDADLQDDPGEVPKLIAKLEEGYDCAVGWRESRQDPGNKIRMSHLFNGVVSKLGHIQLHDMNCGLKAFKKKVIEEIHLYGELHRFIPLLVATRGFRVTETPIVHHARKYGYSKYNMSRVFHAFFDLVTTLFINAFETRPLKLFGPVGVMLTGIGILFLIYLSYLHFLGETIGDRPLLLLGILLVLFGVQLFSTGLLGELMINMNAGKEKYPVDQVIS